MIEPLVEMYVEMLHRESVSHADLLNLEPFLYGRFPEYRKILAGGRQAKYWLSTRLALGLSEIDADIVGHHLRELGYDTSRMAKSHYG